MILNSRIEMWLAIFGSILLIGASLFVVNFVYTKMKHPDLIFATRKTFLDCVKDSFASLVQSEAPPMFRTRPTFSAGMMTHVTIEIKRNLKMPFLYEIFINRAPTYSRSNILAFK